MTATAAVLMFPRPRRGEVSSRTRAEVLTERMAVNLAHEDPRDCADALIRLLASITCCNAINLTEAVETAQLVAIDLEALVREMMQERA